MLPALAVIDMTAVCDLDEWDLRSFDSYLYTVQEILAAVDLFHLITSPKR